MEISQEHSTYICDRPVFRAQLFSLWTLDGHMGSVTSPSSGCLSVKWGVMVQLVIHSFTRMNIGSGTTTVNNIDHKTCTPGATFEREEMVN